MSCEVSSFPLSTSAFIVTPYQSSSTSSSSICVSAFLCLFLFHTFGFLILKVNKPVHQSIGLVAQSVDRQLSIHCHQVRRYIHPFPKFPHQWIHWLVASRHALINGNFLIYLGIWTSLWSPVPSQVPSWNQPTLKVKISYNLLLETSHTMVSHL